MKSVPPFRTASRVVLFSVALSSTAAVRASSAENGLRQIDALFEA